MVSRRSLRSVLNQRRFCGFETLAALGPQPAKVLWFLDARCARSSPPAHPPRWPGDQPEPSPAAGDRRRDPGVRRRQATRAARRPAGLQAVLQREPVPAAARCPRGRGGRGRPDEPLSRHGQQRAVRRPGRPARRGSRTARRGHRVGGRALPPAPGVLRARRRGRLRMAVLRGLPDRGVGDRCRLGAGAGHAPTAGTTSTPWPPGSPPAPGPSSCVRRTTPPARR